MQRAIGWYMVACLVTSPAAHAQAAGNREPQPRPAVAAPYPPSNVIAGLEWAPKESIVRLAKDSDTWPLTWGDDDCLYTAFGDGTGFLPKVPQKLSLGLARVEGGPTDCTGVNIRAPSMEQKGDGPKGKKASGILMVDGVLYLWVRNAGNAQLAWSTDHAKTWTWADWKCTVGFGCSTFLNFGKNYAGARDHYVYVYSHDSDSAYQAADRMVLARVPKDRIKDREAYEFFKGLDKQGNPAWSQDINQRGVVFTHPGKCYRSGITYNAGLKRYLWCQILPTSKHPQGPRFQGGFGVYDAPEPWGPWTTVYYTEDWDVGPGETSSFPTKWMSDDGKMLHLVFSGNDSFSVRRATLRLVPGAASLGARAASAPPAVPFEWQTATPESQGMSAEKLEALKDGLAARKTKALLVVRNDKIVYEWYAADHGPNKPHYTASMAKAIVAGLSLGVAMSDGRIALDDQAAKYVPQWRDDPRKSKITLRQLGSHTAGIEDAESGDVPHNKLTGWKGDFWKRLPVPNDAFTLARDKAPVVFEPGRKSAYSNPGIAMLTYCVTAALRDALQKDIRTLLRDRVMRPIGVADDQWSVGYNKTYTVDGLPLVGSWGGGSFTARAVARIGRLMLREGDWGGRQLLSKEAVRQITGDAGTPGNGAIGWWSNNEGPYPQMPRDAYWGAGAGHQIVLVVPSLKLVAVRNGNTLEIGPDGEFDKPLNKFLFAPLMDAITPPRESWDNAAPMKRVAAKFLGRPGVVLHVGDSIAYANPYGQWAGHDGKAEQGVELGDRRAMPPSPQPSPGGRGEPAVLRLPVTRDTWLSAVGKEANCNLGGATRLKLKSIQEMSLVDFDPAPLRGRVIRGGELHLRLATSERLHRVTVSSVAADWVEGTSPNYAPQKGSSCFNWRKYPDVPWAYPGSDLTAVTLGQGGTIWHSADATPPDDQGWQTVPVDTRVLAARVAGISYGLLVFDDTGSEWTRDGEQFKHRMFPNRFVYSRDQSPSSAPYLTVSLGETDNDPPLHPGLPTAGFSEALSPGNPEFTWETPADRGSAGTIGFLLELNDRPIPQYLVPRAGRPGEKVAMLLRDLGIRPGQMIDVKVRAVDAADNIGPTSASAGVDFSAVKIEPLPGKRPEFDRTPAPLPKLAGAEVAILDALDKVHPVTGRMIPAQPPEYLSANHLWNAGRKEIRLAAARGETVDFQILLRGTVRGVRPSLDLGIPCKSEFSRYRYVPCKDGPLPDPIVPLEQPLDLPTAEEKIAGQQYGSLLCEIYVAKDAAPGAHRGTFRLTAEGGAMEIPVLLEVWNFTLPDQLHFLPEMNCYGLPSNERDYYRLAHLHRTVLDRVPYSQSGHVAEGCAPQWDGKRLDWSAWDKRFGPYFDGSAFADLPRKNVPLEIFYLPLHESWPTPMEGNYNGSYWADHAFPESYRAAFVEAARQMTEHFAAQGWRETRFLGFLNNKNNFKQGGWSRGSSPWLLDEPANFQDYWALRWFGDAFHEGVQRAAVRQGPRPLMLFRCDISRPEWQRDLFDPVLNYNVVGGGAFRQYHRLVLDRKKAFGQTVLDYGSTNAIHESNMQPVGWCIDSWSLESDGVVPWQTVGTEKSWKEADTLSLFYPGRPVGLSGPVPSIRLKAYRRGQQDAEQFRMLCEVLGQPQWAVGQAIRQTLQLAGEHRDTGFTGGEDAGVLSYKNLRPQDAWAVRYQVARAITR